jgi:hypothetical protein
VSLPDQTIIVTDVAGAQRKSPAALAAGLDSLFFKRGNCESGNRRQMLSYCYWILIFFFLFLLFFWRLNPVSDRYTYPGAATLRLGRVLKARPVPTRPGAAGFQ